MLMQMPSLEADASVLCDWFEISALSNENGCANLHELRNQVDLMEDEHKEDFLEEDQFVEDVQTKVENEFEHRQEALKNAYPFTVTEDGGHLRLKQTLGDGDYIYLFCLVISHATKSEVLEKRLRPVLDSFSRDLFQVCATLCAAGYVRGAAISFGFPRPDGSKILEKLREFASYFGEGRVHPELPPGAPRYAKDDDIDVIAWRTEPDRFAGSLLLMGQAASGVNWREKSPRNAIENVFLPTWFSVQIASKPIAAMFIPFCPPVDEVLPYDKGEPAVGDQSWRDVLEFGQLFHRYRIPRISEDVHHCVEAGWTPVERYNDVVELRKWVEKYLNILRSEVG